MNTCHAIHSSRKRQRWTACISSACTVVGLACIRPHHGFPKRLIQSGELAAKRRGKKSLLIEAWSVEAYLASLPAAGGGR